MEFSPGPATLWGILKSEHPPIPDSPKSVAALSASPVPAPPAENIGLVSLEIIPRVPSPMVHPARDVFGNSLDTLVTPPYNGTLLQAMFCHSANAADFIRLNYGLFHNDYPCVRDIGNPIVLLLQAPAAVEMQFFDVDVSVLVASGVPILVHVEMLRALPQLYWMFVDPRTGLRYRVVNVIENADVWKIALLAIYGTEDFALDDAEYTGEDYIAAIVLVQQWAGQDYVLRTVVDYFKTYCAQVARTLHNSPVPFPGHLLIANVHEHVLREAQNCFLQYQAVHGQYRTLAQGAFGSWALRAIYSPYLISRLEFLTQEFREEIALALMIHINADIIGYPLEDPIFLD
ncbi:hypothetical protein F4814DRAFT_451132 [Daldinia grandis]|nr:hypothetical protein F4814DRAFT_451132 [Daldinia grandis]